MPAHKIDIVYKIILKVPFMNNHKFSFCNTRKPTSYVHLNKLVVSNIFVLAEKRFPVPLKAQSCLTVSLF